MQSEICAMTKNIIMDTRNTDIGFTQLSPNGWDEAWDKNCKDQSEGEIL